MTAICQAEEKNHNHRKPMINFYNLLMFTLMLLLPIVEQTNGMKKMKTYIEKVKKVLPGSRPKTNYYDPFKNHYEYSEKEDDRRMRQMKKKMHEQAKNSAHNLRSIDAEKTFSKQKQTDSLDHDRQMNEFPPISNKLIIATTL